MGKKIDEYHEKKSNFTLEGSRNKSRQAGKLGGKPQNSRYPDTLKISMRSGRQPRLESEQFTPLATIPDFTPPIPEASTVFVEGRSRIDYWTESLWGDFRRFRDIGARLGLAVQIVPVSGDGKTYKRWTRRRFDSDKVLEAIEKEPGILFDDWARIWLGNAEIVTSETYDAARAKALNTLSKFFRTGKVEKRYDARGYTHLHAINPDGSIAE